ncbi:MAG: hypothetical protein MJZ16_02875 [Bacteroidales bacterium]|nr:hypothetical protein [Bacteroidales bacterium]
MEDTLSTIFKVLKWFAKDPDNFTLADVGYDENQLKTILSARNRVASRYITELDKDEIFVFSCDSVGEVEKWGRASAVARDSFGTTKNSGPSGRAYAIPTTELGVPYDLDGIKEGVDAFIRYAGEHSENKFLVTRIACGYNGQTDEDMAMLFKEALKLENVYLPQSFLDVLFHTEMVTDNPSDLVPSDPCDPTAFVGELQRKFSQYLMILKSKYKNAGLTNSKEYRKVIDSVERMCDAIVDSVNLTFRGLPAEAYKRLSQAIGREALNIKNGWILKFTPIPSNNSFYRMRVETDNLVKKTVDEKGMFHITMSLRGIVKTQRYSVPGYPSLYMGVRVFGCWEELGRPNLSNSLVSRLVNKEEFYVLDLRIPDRSAWDVVRGKRSVKLPKQTIVLFPLVIACTFRQKSTSAVFKHEYIIPQLLFQYVKEYGYKKNKNRQKDDREIYGIKYTSVHVDEAGRNGKNEFCKSTGAFDNYVIPVIDIKHDYCERLAEAFSITKPICEEFERGKESMPNGSVFDALETILETIDPTPLNG